MRMNGPGVEAPPDHFMCQHRPERCPTCCELCYDRSRSLDKELVRCV